jgi:hypothetical protein
MDSSWADSLLQQTGAPSQSMAALQSLHAEAAVEYGTNTQSLRNLINSDGNLIHQKKLLIPSTKNTEDVQSHDLSHPNQW